MQALVLLPLLAVHVAAPATHQVGEFSVSEQRTVEPNAGGEAAQPIVELSWVFDPESRSPNVFHTLLLAVKNSGRAAIELPSNCEAYVQISLLDGVGNVLNVPLAEGGDGSGEVWARSLPAGRTVFFEVILARDRLLDKFDGMVACSATLHIGPEAPIQRIRLVGPGRQGSERPADRLTDYSLTSTTAPIGVDFLVGNAKASYADRPERIETGAWEQAVARLEVAAKSKVSDAATWDRVVSASHEALKPVIREWRRALGDCDVGYDCDDIAFAICTLPGLRVRNAILEEHLRWTANQFPRSTGGTRARELLSWIEGGHEEHLKAWWF